MDQKYGRLFTEADVLEIIDRVANTKEVVGIESAQLLAEMEGRHDGPSPFDDLGERPTFRFPVDEPLFLLRAKDIAAQQTLIAYYKECERAGASEEHLDAIDDVIGTFARFKREYPKSMKVPD